MPTCKKHCKIQCFEHLRRMLGISSYLQDHWKIDEKSMPKTSEKTTWIWPRFCSKNWFKKGRKSNQNLAKIEENRRKKCTDIQWNVDRHQDDQKIEKMSEPEGYADPCRRLVRAQGPAVGGRGDNKLSPRTEKRGKWPITNSAQDLTRPGPMARRIFN